MKNGRWFGGGRGEGVEEGRVRSVESLGQSVFCSLLGFPLFSSLSLPLSELSFCCGHLRVEIDLWSHGCVCAVWCFDYER